MTDPSPSFFARLVLAFAAFFKLLVDAGFAAAVRRLTRGAGTTTDAATPTAAPVPAPVVLREATPDAALQLLAILQREGRFVDFVEEDMAAFSDQEIGAAARVVHEGCRRALREHLELATIRAETEGSAVTLEAGFDAKAIRLSGNLVGSPPFKGTLQHRGWRATAVRLPRLAEGHDVHVLAPAEVEL